MKKYLTLRGISYRKYLSELNDDYGDKVVLPPEEFEVEPKPEETPAPEAKPTPSREPAAMESGVDALAQQMRKGLQDFANEKFKIEDPEEFKQMQYERISKNGEYLFQRYGQEEQLKAYKSMNMEDQAKFIIDNYKSNSRFQEGYLEIERTRRDANQKSNKIKLEGKEALG